MAIVQNVIADQSGAPIPGTTAVINLVAPSGAFLLGTQTQAQSVFVLTTGADGKWSQDLTPNASIGSDSYYVVSEPAASKATAFVVPSGAGPMWLSSVKLPAPPGTVVPPPLMVTSSIGSATDYNSQITPTDGQPMVWSSAAGKWQANNLLETLAQYFRVGNTHRTVTYGDASASHLVLDKEADTSDASLLVRSVGYLVGVVGAAGDDDLHLRVATGTPGAETFVDGLVIKRATGYAYAPTRLGVGTPTPGTALDVAGALRTTPVTLTDAATITTDASTSNHFRVILGGNRTLANPTNPADGQHATWEITQPASGGPYTLAFGTAFAFGTDITTITLSAGANKTDYLGAIYNATAGVWRVTALARGF